MDLVRISNYVFWNWINILKLVSILTICATFLNTRASKDEKWKSIAYEFLFFQVYKELLSLFK